MALKIEQNNKVLLIAGALNAQNSISLKTHFEYFLREVDELILNLEDVTFMEPSGAYTVEQLYIDFARRNKNIRIIGKANHNISDVMKQTRTSYILSDDRH